LTFLVSRWKVGKPWSAFGPRHAHVLRFLPPSSLGWRDFGTVRVRTADGDRSWSAGSMRAIRSGCQGLRIWRDFAGPALDDPVDALGNVAGSGRMVRAFLLVP
jgi:hypothetical protein